MSPFLINMSRYNKMLTFAQVAGRGIAKFNGSRIIRYVSATADDSNLVESTFSDNIYNIIRAI